MDNTSNTNRDEVFSKRIKAGKRTYFFDVKATRGKDYYVTITESKRKADGYGYDKHKIFLYKEDFNKFISGLNDAIGHIKTELMPDYDFEKFDHDAESSLSEDGADGADGADFASEFDEIGGYGSIEKIEETIKPSQG
jgi:viroplasmin and RNaseH domain-containing protein